VSVRIKRISIEGFRAIREPLDLEWVDPRGAPLERVVMAGPNGSGKTSVLEAILLALGREELIVRDLPAVARGDHWRTDLASDASVMLDCLDDVAGARFVVTRTADRWEYRVGLEGHDIRVIDDPEDVRRALDSHRVEYFSSWRSPVLPGGLQPTTAGRSPADNEANRLRRLKQQIINERARRAFRTQPTIVGLSKDERWLDRLNAVWSSFHTDDSMINADVVDPDADEPTFDLFVFDGSERRCSIDQVSSGELELLTVAGTLILAEFDGLLLIDEPELHLHPEWQAQLLDMLRTAAPRAQLVVTTHASAPWDQAYSFERFFLAPPNDPRSGVPQLAVAQDD